MPWLQLRFIFNESQGESPNWRSKAKGLLFLTRKCLEQFQNSWNLQTCLLVLLMIDGDHLPEAMHQEVRDKVIILPPNLSTTIKNWWIQLKMGQCYRTETIIALRLRDEGHRYELGVSKKNKANLSWILQLCCAPTVINSVYCTIHDRIEAQLIKHCGCSKSEQEPYWESCSTNNLLKQLWLLQVHCE